MGNDTTKADLAQIDEHLKRLQNEFSGILSRRRALLDITDEEMGNAGWLWIILYSFVTRRIAIGIY